MSPPSNTHAQDADPAAGPDRDWSALNGSPPRHRRGVTPAGGRAPTEPAAEEYSPERLLHNLLIAVAAFEEILIGLDPKKQKAALTAATEAHDRLRAAFDAASRHHADFDEWEPIASDTDQDDTYQGDTDRGLLRYWY